MSSATTNNFLQSTDYVKIFKTKRAARISKKKENYPLRFVNGTLLSSYGMGEWQPTIENLDSSALFSSKQVIILNM